MRVLIVLLLLLSGCVTPLNNLEHLSPKNTPAYQISVDSIKYHYFTPEARKYIRDIPCIDGNTIGGSFVVGANFWGTLAGIFTLNGFAPKNVMDVDGIKIRGVEDIIHEYIHHLDASGREGRKLFIDIEEFKRAFRRMGRDQKWAGLAYYADDKASWWFTKVFGIGNWSEQIAYVAGRMAAQWSGPEYMWWVFRRVFNR